MKSIGSIAKYTLLAIWLIAVSLAISIGIKQATAFAVDGRVVQKETFNLNPTDTLYIKFKHNDYFAKNVDDRNGFLVTQDSTGTDIIYSNDVRITIERTDEKTPYIQIEKEAKGKSLAEAKRRAEQIKYSYKIEGNQLILDNYLLTNLKNKYRDQEIEITLFLPKGTLIKPDDSMQNYDRTDSDYFLWNPGQNEIYKVGQNKIICTNCANIDNDDVVIGAIDNTGDYGDVVIDTNDDTKTSVTINQNGISIKKDSITNTNKKFKELKINKDGIIIKTN